MEKASALLATYYPCFEASNKELCDIDKKFDGQFEELSELSVKVDGG